MCNHPLVLHLVLCLLRPQAHPDHLVHPVHLVEEDPDMGVRHQVDFLLMVLVRTCVQSGTWWQASSWPGTASRSSRSPRSPRPSGFQHLNSCSEQGTA
jgi:hypothetical protein